MPSDPYAGIPPHGRRRRRPPGFYFLLVVLAFVLGVLLDRAGWLPGSTGRRPAGLGHTFDPFWETWRLVDDHYVDREAIQPKRMTEGAIEGLLASLGDLGHTTYLPANEYAKMVDELKHGEHLEGIGARVSLRKEQPTILATRADSPARRAGLKPGDALLEVDDKFVAGMPLDRVVMLVAGPPGTKVRLKVAREGESHPLDFTIERARIEVPDVTWAMLPGQPIAHIAVHRFESSTDAHLRAALKDAFAADAKGLIVDVRGNPGGLKEQAVAVTSEFLKNGDVFIEQDAKGKRRAIAVQPGGIATDIPLAVLIDEGSASSAEIFAGAIQDHQRGKLVGTHTFGTGTVLEPFELSDGSAVLLAVREWLTPNGRQIWHQGIKPDVDVSLPTRAEALLPEAESNLDASGLAKSDDKQLLQAVAAVNEEIRGRINP